MSIIFEDRNSDSPYIDTVSRGYTDSDGSTIRPAESCWHMVFTRFEGRALPILVGPLSTAGVVSFSKGAEMLWLKFRLGAFMPHLPIRQFRDSETVLPEAAGPSFWLKGSAFQFPDYDNTETFVNRLVRAGVLALDPQVDEALRGRSLDLSPRTVRHRFLQATGLTQTHIYQIERAKRAQAILQQGIPILDAVEELGYYDQPHLTRSLKQWVGHTPAQLARAALPA